jgi:cyclohexanone monooxygenase
MLPSIEQHVDWIAHCVAYLRERDIAQIELQQAEDDCGNDTSTRSPAPTCARVQLVVRWRECFRASRACSCRTSRLAHLPGKCKEIVAAAGYRGFLLSGAVTCRATALEDSR